jgi:CheY-like chemotaxis protein
MKRQTQTGPERQPGGSPVWLIVEDEALVAMLVQDAVEEIGCRTVGPAARVADALALIGESVPDAALLDVNLAGEKVYPVADHLMAHDIPFVFLTGYGDSDIDPRFRDRPTIRKPFTPKEIQTTVSLVTPLARS